LLSTAYSPAMLIMIAIAASLIMFISVFCLRVEYL
jgi:hypothetical protein